MVIILLVFMEVGSVSSHRNSNCSSSRSDVVIVVLSFSRVSKKK